jgi:hypothetical protein
MEMSHVGTIYGRVLHVKHKIASSAIKLRDEWDKSNISLGSYVLILEKCRDSKLLGLQEVFISETPVRLFRGIDYGKQHFIFSRNDGYDIYIFSASTL